MIKSYWPDEYLAKRKTPEEAIKLIKAGQRVFIGSSCGEPQRLVKALADQARYFSDIEVVRMLTLEKTSLTAIAEKSGGRNINVRSFYLGSGKPKAISKEKRFLTPINLSAVPRLFKSRQLPVQAALIQVSPPDDFGWMSLGISVDVSLAAAQAADVVIAQVNPNMPRVLGRGFIHVNEIDAVVEYEEPLLEAGSPPEFEAAHQIGRFVARLIDDGSTMQISLGSTHQAALLAMSQKNDLGIHTQFLSDSILRLFSLGVINNNKKGFNEGKLVASGAIGSPNLYEFMNDNPAIEIQPSDYVNDPSVIRRHNKMVAMNVAMAMDLTGQAAADSLPFNHFTGVSGIMDFMRGAAGSPGGKSILMTPSTTADGKASRIVLSLQDMAVVVPRGDVQYVVTEYGLVNLFGKSLQERAVAMISIAHPDFRDELFDQAKEAGLIGPDRKAFQSMHGVYPVKLEETRYYDGVRVLFRPAKLVDERQIQEHFYQMDRQDVVNRFFHDKRSFIRDDVADVFQIDYINDLTIVAVVGEGGAKEVAAVGTYLLNPADNIAEVAFSTAKEWQGKGLAGVLLTKLAGAALENGLSGFVAYTSPRNAGMIALFRKLPYEVTTTFEDDFLVLKAMFH